MTQLKRKSTAEKAFDNGTLTPLRVWLPATVNVATFRSQFQAWVAAETIIFENGQGVFLEDECLHLFSTLGLTAYMHQYRSQRFADTYKDGTPAVTKLTTLGYTGLSWDRLRQQFGNSYGKYLEFLRTHRYLQVYNFYDAEGLASDGTDLFGVAPTKRNYTYQQKGHKKANTGSYIGKKAGSKEEGLPKQYRLHNDHALENAVGFDAIYPIKLGLKYSYKAHKFYTKEKASTLRKRATHSPHRQRMAEYVDSLLRNVDYAGMEAWLRAKTGTIQEMSPVWSLYYADQLRQGIVQFENLSDDFGHRLHTPLTNMPTELRRFYRPNDNQVYSMDIRCSQFVLAAYLFKYPEQCFKLLTENGDMDPATVRYVLDTLHAAYVADEKVRQFCYDAIHTDLYATTATELGLKDRAAGKNLWFGAFFSTTGEFASVKRQLGRLYGSLLIVTSKLNDPKPGSNVKQNLMPMMLQLLEQRLLIEGVANHLTVTYDGVFGSVHDSIHIDEAGIPHAAAALGAVFTAASLPVPPYKIEGTDDQGNETKTLVEPAPAATTSLPEPTPMNLSDLFFDLDDLLAIPDEPVVELLAKPTPTTPEPVQAKKQYRTPFEHFFPGETPPKVYRDAYQ
ncbi:hypothetical protein MUN81_10265 [Hymenobacter sp. 5317J-9]|uniref:hypothetical protein n=1 Tax=Hymenobacter sp. 5317J-9 TaxID=2932250 RepID=UPI001FD6AB28|nr:hypothetical protein [Hymenobacter sp. 5317J-9]UOQ99862.1 hypothetical protein MUN81_10265 [Hymenobacter sp. 5317J-9]